MSPTETLAEYVVRTDFNDLPCEVVAQAKWCIIDTVGCALGGAQTDVGQRQIGAARYIGGKAEATLIGSNLRTSCLNAAHFNAELANVLDFDDVYWPTQHHPGSPVVYPALAIGEATGASGRDIITGVVVGYEVSQRVGLAIRSIITGSDGKPLVLANPAYEVFGSVASAGKLLGLSTTELINAFGMAGDTPIHRDSRTATVDVMSGARGKTLRDVKYNMGIYTFIGIFAAMRAKMGLSATENILDGERWWRCTGATVCNYAELTKELGDKYRIMDTTLKVIPACGFSQSPAVAVWEALRGETVMPDEITEINLAGLPRLMAYEWDSMVEAEFSLPCSIAMAIAGGEPGPDWYTTGRFKEKDIRELATKVKFKEDLRATQLYLERGQIICTAEIRTKDGRVSKAQIEYVKGSAENPFAESDHKRKFMANTRGILGRSQVKDLWERFVNLEEVKKISQLMKLTSTR